MARKGAADEHTSSVEDYLKTIYELEREGSAAATNEIADRLSVAPASVSGMVRRLAGTICPSQVPERQPGVDGDTEAYSCEVDEECNAAPYGYCEYFGMGESECMYGCVSNEDCESGSVCDCREPVGACVEAHCRSDEDCEDGALCVADWSLWNDIRILLLTVPLTPRRSADLEDPDQRRLRRPRLERRRSAGSRPHYAGR